MIKKVVYLRDNKSNTSPAANDRYHLTQRALRDNCTFTEIETDYELQNRYGRGCASGFGWKGGRDERMNESR